MLWINESSALNDSGTPMRWRLQVDWHQKDDVQRQIRSRIKGELRARGVEQEAMESIAANILDLAKVRSHR